ncbi:MAG TPA: hypothetical protein VHR27_14675 [Blastocatellia bacterium]|nr:hypothetical protein [Blastocatellia bacterium]
MTKQLSKIALATIVVLACFGIRAQESGRQAPPDAARFRADYPGRP